MFGIEKLFEEIREMRVEIKLLYNKLDGLEWQINDLKMSGNDISLPNELNKEIQAVNALYKTKQGLFSFKKAKRAIREEF